MTIEESIRQICENTLKPLEYVSKNGAKTINEYIIKCESLKDFNYNDIREDQNFEILFKNIQKIEGPTVYYFEVVSGHQSDEIVKALKLYSLSENAKTTPPLNPTYSKGKILYVGKVKKKMWGRLIQHLGFYKVNKTQGLQLYYWAMTIPLTLKLVVIEFEPEMDTLVGVIEKKIAHNLNPMLGKHRD